MIKSCRGTRECVNTCMYVYIAALYTAEYTHATMLVCTQQYIVLGGKYINYSYIAACNVDHIFTFLKIYGS